MTGVPAFLRVLLVVLPAAGGCQQSPAAFHCTVNDECVYLDAAGVCEASGFCSFPDDRCDSHRRYGVHAAAVFAGRCVVARVGGDGRREAGEGCDDSIVDSDGGTLRCARCPANEGRTRLAWPTNATYYVRHDQPCASASALESCAACGERSGS